MIEGKMSQQELVKNIQKWEKHAEHIEPIFCNYDNYNVEWIAHGRIQVKYRRYWFTKYKIIYETPQTPIEEQVDMLKRELDKNKSGSLAWEISYYKSALKHKIKNAQKIAKRLGEISEWGVQCNHCHKSYRHGEYDATEYNLFICPNCGATDEDITEVLLPKIQHEK